MNIVLNFIWLLLFVFVLLHHEHHTKISTFNICWSDVRFSFSSLFIFHFLDFRNRFYVFFLILFSLIHQRLGIPKCFDFHDIIRFVLHVGRISIWLVRMKRCWCRCSRRDRNHFSYFGIRCKFIIIILKDPYFLSVDLAIWFDEMP